MTGQEMVGISRYNWFFILVAFFATLSCVKEEVVEQPVENQPDRFTEYDPVVRFGLETYMGGDEETKTIYAGEDEYDLTVVLSRIRKTSWILSVYGPMPYLPRKII